MFMPLLSPATGVIHWVLPEGSILSAGDLIARLDLENPAAVTQAMPFDGDFPPMGAPVLESEGVDAWFTGALQAAQMIMAGVHRVHQGLIPPPCRTELIISPASQMSYSRLSVHDHTLLTPV